MLHLFRVRPSLILALIAPALVFVAGGCDQRVVAMQGTGGSQAGGAGAGGSAMSGSGGGPGGVGGGGLGGVGGGGPGGGGGGGLGGVGGGSSAGANGGGGASAAGHGGGGAGGRTDQGECTPAAACPKVCAPNGPVCFQATNGTTEVPPSSSLTVVSASLRTWSTTDVTSARCLSNSHRPVAQTNRVLIQLTDGSGGMWDLSLPPDLVSPDRYLVGTALTVKRVSRENSLISTDQRLIVSVGGAVDLFFLDGGVVFLPTDVPEVGLSFDRGDETCSYAPNGTGCVVAAQSKVSDGVTTLTDPCPESLGGFAVKSNFIVAPKCAPGQSCDNPNWISASGVRLRSPALP